MSSSISGRIGDEEPEEAASSFASESLRLSAEGIFSFAFPSFGSSLLGLYPEAPIRLVSELEATDEAGGTVSRRVNTSHVSRVLTSATFGSHDQ